MRIGAMEGSAPVAGQVVQLEEAGLLSLHHLLAHGLQVVWHAMILYRHPQHYVTLFGHLLNLFSPGALQRSHATTLLISISAHKAHVRQ